MLTGVWHGPQESGAEVELIVHDDRSLLALQGPSAASVLQSMVTIDLSKLYFGNFVKENISGVPCFITRTGCDACDSEPFLSYSGWWAVLGRDSGSVTVFFSAGCGALYACG